MTEKSVDGKKEKRKTNATKQATPRAGRGGTVPPKKRQFGQPEGNKRSDGRWKKEDSITYQYNKLLRMTQAELIDFSKRLDLTVAQKIAVSRVLDAVKMSTATKSIAPLHTTTEITDRTEGKAKNAVAIELSQKDGEGLNDQELEDALFG